MCNGKDEQKPHLHYPAAARAVAKRLENLTGLETGPLLEIAVSIGMRGMCDFLKEECHQEAVFIDGHKYAKLVSTREIATNYVEDLKRQYRYWTQDPIKPMRLIQEDLPF